eukprot:1199354-Pyramimonas_sp.AAC.1
MTADYYRMTADYYRMTADYCALLGPAATDPLPLQVSAAVQWCVAGVGSRLDEADLCWGNITVRGLL